MKKPHKTAKHTYFINSAFHRLLHLGQSCAVCGTPSPNLICEQCLSYFPHPHYRCQTCGIPTTKHTIACGRCLKHPPHYDEVYSPYLYQTPLDNLINQFKHQRQELVGKGLNQRFCDSIAHHYQQQHRVIPNKVLAVPLHWRKQWQREFNQSEIFSRDIAKRMGIQHLDHVKRTRSTSPQKTLSRKARLRNLRGCFQVQGSLKGETIAIVDDVMTTGVATSSTPSILGLSIGWLLARAVLILDKTYPCFSLFPSANLSDERPC